MPPGCVATMATSSPHGKRDSGVPLQRELQQSQPQGLDHNWVSCFGYRPVTAEAILQNWVQAEPKLFWWPGCRLVAVERREQWGESSAPSQRRLDTEAFFREQPVQSPAWVVMGQLQSDQLAADPARGIDPAVTPPLPAPFERVCDAFGLERTLTYGHLPGGLVMLNWPLHGNDWQWGLERAFSGDPAQPAELHAETQAHSLHFAEAPKSTICWPPTRPSAQATWPMAPPACSR